MRMIARLLGLLVLLGAGALCYGWFEARRDPVVRRATVPLADWPVGARPIRVALISDLHFGNATMAPERTARIAGQVMALRPDMILIAGDFIGGHGAEDAVSAAPDLDAGLARLRAPLGVIAVLGNHDHSSDPAIVRRALATARVTLLANEAVRRGPLVIGGLDDLVTGHQNVATTLDAMARLTGAKIILTHSPAIAPFLRPTGSAVAPQTILAGHSHCGQVVLPGIGPLMALTDRRRDYPCGDDRSGPDRIIVSGGLGTSIFPVRIGAPSDWWLITFGPAAPG